MKRICPYCKKGFNGWIALLEHERQHPEYVKEIKKMFRILAPLLGNHKIGWNKK